MKKIFFYTSLFICCSSSAMQPEHEEYAKSVVKKSQLVMFKVVHDLPPQPWRSPSARIAVVKQCRQLEEHLQTLRLTKSYQVNKTMVSVMNTFIDVAEQIQVIMREIDDKNSTHLVDTIQKNMRIRKFRFVTELYQLLMSTTSARKKT